MQGRVHTLSEREKETLRLLLRGHDAKSAATALSLSVHTVNERLREARRKLGVGSSREAARLLAEVEDPNFSGDKLLGVAAVTFQGGDHDASDNPPRKGQAPAWLFGGMMIMLAIVAVVAVATVLQGDGGARLAMTPVALAASPSASDKASAGAAEAWTQLLDRQRWGESWKASATSFKSRITEAGWGATIQPLRGQLGPVSSRSLKSVSSTNTLPGAPDGDYKIVQFDTAFANKSDAVETVVLTREGAAWVVSGYFIR
ncbi:helix-turn-helix domain-containing protein [Caulobacter segnis]